MPSNWAGMTAKINKGLRCGAAVWERRTLDDRAHQCRYRATTERAVGFYQDGAVRRIPVCRIHSTQRRSRFGEFRGVRG